MGRVGWRGQKVTKKPKARAALATAIHLVQFLCQLVGLIGCLAPPLLQLLQADGQLRQLLVCLLALALRLHLGHLDALQVGGHLLVLRLQRDLGLLQGGLDLREEGSVRHTGGTVDTVSD